MTDYTPLSDSSPKHLPLGFVILSHHMPEQLLRLVRTLGMMFGGPPIVCHHDFRKCPLDDKRFPTYCRFIRDPVKTCYGGHSLVRATLVGLRELREYADPDWIALLSGQDYPIKSAERILQTLRETPYNALIRCEHLDPRSPANDWQRRCVRRYFRKYVRFPYINRHGRPRFDLIGLPRVLSNPFIPFNDRLQCYVGSQWFVGDRRSVTALLEETWMSYFLDRHYNRVATSNESYMQCILANRKELFLSGRSPTYVRFARGNRSPNLLTDSDLPDLIASDCLFARKLHSDWSETLLESLDRVCAGDKLEVSTLKSAL